MALLSIEHEGVGSNVNALFADDADLATVCQNRIHLTPELKRGWIVPADYDLNTLESRLLLKLLVNQQKQAVDPRYRLAHTLLNPAVRREFAAIIIDTPPRMTLGTANAFIASHWYLAPTILDRVSAQAVEPFVRSIEAMKRDLDLDVRLAGIISMMTREEELNENEIKVREHVSETIAKILGGDRNPFIAGNIPRRSVVTNGATARLSYFLRDAQHAPMTKFYDPIFDEIWSRIMPTAG